jgi:hypothetical protein
VAGLPGSFECWGSFCVDIMSCSDDKASLAMRAFLSDYKGSHSWLLRRKWQL